MADGVSYAFQGKIFAAGRLWLEPPPVPEAFRARTSFSTRRAGAASTRPASRCFLRRRLARRRPVPRQSGPSRPGGLRRLPPGNGPLRRDDRALRSAPPRRLAVRASHGSGLHGPRRRPVRLDVVSRVSARRGAGERDARPLLVSGLLGAFGVVVRPQAAVFFLLPALIAVLVARRKELARSAGFLALGGAAPLAFLLAYNFALSGMPCAWHTSSGTRGLSVTFATTAFSFSQLLSSHSPWYLHDLDATVWGFPWGDLVPLVLLLFRRPADGGTRGSRACALALVLGFSCVPLLRRSTTRVRGTLSRRSARSRSSRRAPFARRAVSRPPFSSASASNGSRVARPRLAARLPFGMFPLATLLPRQAGPFPTRTTRTPTEPLRRLEAAGVGAVGPRARRGEHGGVDLRIVPPRERPRPAARAPRFRRDLPERRAELLAAYPRDRGVARQRHAPAAAAPERVDRQHVGRRRRRLDQASLGRGRRDDDLALDAGPGREVAARVRGAPAQDLLVELRELAAEDDRRVAPRPRERLEGLDDPERRFEEDGGSRVARVRRVPAVALAAPRGRESRGT